MLSCVCSEWSKRSIPAAPLNHACHAHELREPAAFTADDVHVRWEIGHHVDKRDQVVHCGFDHALLSLDAPVVKSTLLARPTSGNAAVRIQVAPNT